jgi:excisionase family DNA binding protein
MTPAILPRRYLTPPDVAETLGVNQSKILGWIKRGELAAVNVAAKVGGRPRWRISQPDLEEFLSRRAAAPAPKAARRHKQKDHAIIEFF